MKILILTEYLFPQKNGIAIRFENIINYLRKLGNIVTVYGPSNSPTANINFRSVRNMWNKENIISINTGFSIFIDIMKNDYDIIHIVYPLAIYANFVLIAAKIKNIKVVTSNHVDLIEYNNIHINNKILKYILKLFTKYIIYLPQIKLSNLILTPSNNNDIVKFYNIKTTLFPTGIDTKLFSYSNKKRNNIIVYVGRLSLEKNLFRLLDLFSIIHNIYKLHIIGDGPIKNDLINYVKDKKIKNIYFFGAVLQKDIVKYYQNAKAFLTTSLSETYGFTNLEALSCGTPIIYPHCKVFDNLYIKDFDKTAFTIDNDKEFLQALKYIENNTLHKKCRQYAMTMSWKKATKKLVKIYKNLLY